MHTVIIAIVTIFSFSKPSLCAPPVNLTSHQKVPYFCPADEIAAFTCVAKGTDLVWIVDGRMYSFNAISRLGTVRSNQDSSVVAALTRIWDSSGDGFAYRRSVLTVSVQRSVVDPIAIKCHNGTNSDAEEIYFLPKYNAPNLTLSMINIEFDINLKVWNMSWDSEGRDVIDFYALQINSNQPQFLKNNSAQIISPDPSKNHALSIKAVDYCAQEGPWMRYGLKQQPQLLISQTTIKEVSAGASKTGPIQGILLVAAMLGSVFLNLRT